MMKNSNEKSTGMLHISMLPCDILISWCAQFQVCLSGLHFRVVMHVETAAEKLAKCAGYSQSIAVLTG